MSNRITRRADCGAVLAAAPAPEDRLPSTLRYRHCYCLTCRPGERRDLRGVIYQWGSAADTFRKT